MKSFFRTFEHASHGRGKGCAMFSLASRKLSNSKQSVVREKYQIMSIVDITVQSHPYQLILVYASSGCPYQMLVDDLKKLLLPDITIIITGDFNFDKKENNSLTQYLGARMLTQLVTWPTHKEGRTIDHCYVSKDARLQITRHSPYYSDHDALCIAFEHFPWNQQYYST